MISHTFFMGLSTLLRLLTGVVVFFVMARTWGPNGFGHFMYWFTVTSLVSLVVDYGFVQQLMKDISIAPDKTSQYISNTFDAKFVLSLGVVLPFIAYSMFSTNLSIKEQGMLWILLLASLFGTYADTLMAVFRSIGKFHVETKIAAWVNLTQFITIIVFLYLRLSPTVVACAFLLSRIVYLKLSLNSFYEHSYTLHVFQKNWLKNSFVTLKNGFAFASEVAFTNFQSQVDTLIVNFYLGSASLGIYQAGLRLMQGSNMFAQVLSNVYLPTLSSTVHRESLFKEHTQKLFLKMASLGFLFFLTFIFFPKLITNLIFGESYQELSQLLPWFGVLLLIRYIAAGHGVILSAIGLQKFRVFAIFLALIILFLSVFILVPKYHLKGMLFSAIFSVAALYLFYLLVLIRHKISTGINKFNLIFLMIISLVFLGWLKT